MKKRVISLLVCISLMFAETIQASASTKTIIIDNDALASSGTTNPEDDGGGIKFCCSNMDYVVGPNHYNEDARRTQKSQTGSYDWKRSFPSGTSKIKLSAYLWDPLFTDPKASYDIGSDVLNYVSFVTINQNTAQVDEM